MATWQFTLVLWKGVAKYIFKEGVVLHVNSKAYVYATCGKSTPVLQFSRALLAVKPHFSAYRDLKGNANINFISHDLSTRT